MKLVFLAAGLVALQLISTVAGVCQESCQAGKCFDPPNECRMCEGGKGLQYNRQSCVDCPDFCGHCYQDVALVTQCKWCAPGYLLENNKCTLCPEFCSRCSRDSKTKRLVCLDCYNTFNPVYILKKAMDKCLPCSSNCRSCSEIADDTTTCSACYDNYYKTNTGSCSSCSVSGCRKCSSDGSICTACNKGYNLLSGGTKCLICDGRACNSCINEEDESRPGFAKCTSCKPGYAQEVDACLSCKGTGCIECSPDPETCTGCALTYRVASGSCIGCGYQCNQCKDTLGDSECTECKSYFGLKSKTHASCDICPRNCDVCNSNGQCTTCKNRYKTDSSFKCQACPSNCATCDWDDTLKRTKCKSNGCDTGYVYRGADGTCPKCPENCRVSPNGCYYNSTSDQSECSTCTVLGYIINDLDPTNCLTCPDNCNACQYNETLGMSDCNDNSCNIGYNDEDDATEGWRTTCKECPEGPTECQNCNSTHCLTCNDNFVLNTASWTCDACPTNCKACTLSNDALVCGTCINIYAKRSDDGSCESCPSNCNKCKWSSTLTSIVCDTGKCNAGYALASASGKCYRCPSNCKQCVYDPTAKKTVCNSAQCGDGYAQKDDMSCEKCPDNCNDCIWEDNRLKCNLNRCDSGFGLNSNDLCDPCPNSCDTCALSETDNTLLVCSTCQTGYRKNEDYCGACPAYCTKCTDNKGTMMCAECKNRYALKSADNKCLSCPGSCHKCSISGDSTKCSNCYTGYGITAEGQCQLCSDLTQVENCATCTGANDAGGPQCLTCPREYTFQDDLKKCLPCTVMSGCIKCKDVAREDETMERCMACKEGYVRTMDYQCARMCYTCTPDGKDWVAESLCKEVNETVSTATECVRGVCWTMRQDLGSDNVLVRRGCFNDTGNSCSDGFDLESCTTANGITECKKCCEDANCNTHQLTGLSEDAMAIQCSALLLSLAALVALLFRL